MTRFDYLVVGGGIAGASIAYHLAKHGSTAILEMEDWPGYHASGRSAALLLPSYGNQTVRALTKLSREFFVGPPSGFSETALVQPCGCLFIGREDQAGDIRSLADQDYIDDARIDLLSAEDAVAAVPILRRDYVAMAALEVAAMSIDTHALHQGYLRGAKQCGALLITSAEVLEIVTRNGEFVVRTQSHAFKASYLINAAGAWAGRIGKLASATSIALTPLRRTVVLLDAPAGGCANGWPCVADIGDQFYFKPDGGRILTSPADESLAEPSDAQPDELDVAICIDRLERATTLKIQRVAKSWAGLRTFAPDRSPIVGFDPNVPNFFWLAGQGGYGMQTAPALAHLASRIVRGLPQLPELEAVGIAEHSLSPSRLSIE